MVYLRTNFHGHEVTIRDVEESDIEALVSYWHDSDPAYLSSLGVNVAKLASREQTKCRFLSSIPGAQDNPERATFIVTSDGQPVAYTNLNFSSTEEAYVHFHTFERSALVKGVVYLLFPEMFRIFFRRFPLNRLIMQTSPENENITRFLGSFGLVPRRVYISKPDGMARAGEFNVYEIPRVAADGLGRRAQTNGHGGE